MLDKARARVEEELNQHVMAEKYGQLYKNEMSALNGKKFPWGGVQLLTEYRPARERVLAVCAFLEEGGAAA